MTVMLHVIINSVIEITKHSLIYDQDCSFCQNSVNKLQKILGEQIDYIGRLELQDGDYGISHKASSEAIQLIFFEDDSYQVYSAAHAIFKALSLKPGWGLWLWLYTYIPGFGMISELVYKIIASNRSQISSCKI